MEKRNFRFYNFVTSSALSLRARTPRGREKKTNDVFATSLRPAYSVTTRLVTLWQAWMLQYVLRQLWSDVVSTLVRRGSLGRECNGQLASPLQLSDEACVRLRSNSSFSPASDSLKEL